MESPEITTLKRMQENEAELGRKWHPDFVSTLASNAEETLGNWLKANQAPEEVQDLFQNCILLERWQSGFEHNDLSDQDASWMTQALPEITQQIVTLGGVFTGGGCQTIPQEPIKWIPQPEEVK